MNCSLPVNQAMKSWSCRLITTAASLLFAGAASHAFAQCGMPRNLAAAANVRPSVSALTSAAAADPQISRPRSEKEDSAREDIVGLWYLTQTDNAGNVTDRVFSGWTSDGLEFDQDLSPILTGYVCYGTWIKIGHHTYGLTHPFFSYQDSNTNGEGSEATEGQWDGNSGYFDYTVVVDESGKTLSGKGSYKVVEGPDPYDPAAKVLFSGTFKLTGTKVEVNKAQLP